jgi:putative ABC transport system ATP-binding protein
MTLIALDRVEKVYGSGPACVRALRGITLGIEHGEFVAIMGASGSGKSTLMNIVGCLDRPTSGSYHLDGEDVSQLSRAGLAHIRNRKIGFVFQHFNLLPRYSALENVMMPLLYAGVSAREQRRRGMEMLAQVGLTDWARHLPNELSGGQQQRVAIARALVSHPQILLADEPTGNLDSQTAASVMEQFQLLHHGEGQTIVLITHDATIATSAARLVRLMDGQVVGDEQCGHSSTVEASGVVD